MVPPFLGLDHCFQCSSDRRSVFNCIRHFLAKTGREAVVAADGSLIDDMTMAQLTEFLKVIHLHFPV